MGKSEMINYEQQPTILPAARTPLKSNFSINAILPNLTSAPSALSTPSPSNASEQEYSDGDVNVDVESETDGKYRIHFANQLLKINFILSSLAAKKPG